jgi:hypothetical protein
MNQNTFLELRAKSLIVEALVSDLKDEILRLNLSENDVASILSFVMPPYQTEYQSLVDKPGTLVFWGETDFANGLPNVMELFASVLRSPQRKGSERPILHISGGAYGREHLGEFGAAYMQKMLDMHLECIGGQDYLREFYQKVRVVTDPSAHTGQQKAFLMASVKALGVKNVIMVEPMYHMPRICTTMAHGIYHEKLSVKLWPMSYGNWDTHHFGKRREGDVHGVKYRELLGAVFPSMGADDVKSIDGGEIAKFGDTCDAARPDNPGNNFSIPEFAKWIRENYAN